MSTDVQGPIDEKIHQLRELFADAPEVGKTALENVDAGLVVEGDGASGPGARSASAGDVGGDRDRAMREREREVGGVAGAGGAGGLDDLGDRDTDGRNPDGAWRWGCCPFR